MVIEGEVRRKKQKRKERRSEEFYSKKFEEESRVETSFFFPSVASSSLYQLTKKKQIKQRERGGPQLAPPFKALSSSPIASSNHRQVAAATEAGARGRERPLLGRERDDKGSVFFSPAQGHRRQQRRKRLLNRDVHLETGQRRRLGAQPALVRRKGRGILAGASVGEMRALFGVWMRPPRCGRRPPVLSTATPFRFLRLKVPSPSSLPFLLSKTTQARCRCIRRGSDRRRLC
jgi:hypothetical protein